MKDRLLFEWSTTKHYPQISKDSWVAKKTLGRTKTHYEICIDSYRFAEQKDPKRLFVTTLRILQCLPGSCCVACICASCRLSSCGSKHPKEDGKTTAKFNIDTQNDAMFEAGYMFFLHHFCYIKFRECTDNQFLHLDITQSFPMFKHFCGRGCYFIGFIGFIGFISVVMSARQLLWKRIRIRQGRRAVRRTDPPCWRRWRWLIQPALLRSKRCDPRNAALYHQLPPVPGLEIHIQQCPSYL